MNLYYQQKNKYPQSSKPPIQIILIHGWAMNSAVWEQLADELAEILPVTIVDLPGYGQSPMFAYKYSLENLAESCRVLLEQAHTSIILAWSFGGLVGIAMADMFPKQVTQLILVGASPCFVQAKDWPNAVEASVFQQFASSLKKDIDKTINRFMVLQMLGSRTAKQDARRVSQSIRNQGPPNPIALEKGLEILLNEDRRQQMYSLQQPIMLVCGSRDTLVKAAALEQLSKRDNIELNILSDAGHVPFVSHFDEFYTLLEQTIRVNKILC